MAFNTKSRALAYGFKKKAVSGAAQGMSKTAVNRIKELSIYGESLKRKEWLFNKENVQYRDALKP